MRFPHASSVRHCFLCSDRNHSNDWVPWDSQLSETSQFVVVARWALKLMPYGFFISRFSTNLYARPTVAEHMETTSTQYSLVWTLLLCLSSSLWWILLIVVGEVREPQFSTLEFNKSAIFACDERRATCQCTWTRPQCDNCFIITHSIQIAF